LNNYSVFITFTFSNIIRKGFSMRRTFQMASVLSVVAVLMLFVIPNSAHASGVVTTSSITHSTIAIPQQQCDQLKKVFPQHRSDPQLCQITETHTFSGVPSVIKSIQTHSVGALSPAACRAGSDIISTDDLRYSYFWTVELDTNFRYNGSGCAPSLIDQDSFTKWSDFSSVSETTRTLTDSGKVTVIQDIQSTNYGPIPISFHSCQSRGQDYYGDTFYASYLHSGGC
jgi:hypothetical protein